MVKGELKGVKFAGNLWGSFRLKLKVVVSNVISFKALSKFHYEIKGTCFDEDKPRLTTPQPLSKKLQLHN